MRRTIHLTTRNIVKYVGKYNDRKLDAGRICESILQRLRSNGIISTDFRSCSSLVIGSTNWTDQIFIFPFN